MMGIHVQVKYKATNLQLICWRNHWRFHNVFSVVFKKLQSKQGKHIKGTHTKDFNRSFKFVHGYYTLPVVEFQVQSGSLILWGNFLRKLGICRFSFYFSEDVQNACVFSFHCVHHEKKNRKCWRGDVVEKIWRLSLTHARDLFHKLANVYILMYTCVLFFSKDQAKNNIYLLLARVSVVVVVVKKRTGQNRQTKVNIKGLMRATIWMWSAFLNQLLL